MRCRGPVRRGALAGVVGIALAAAAAGCGREGDLSETRAETPPPATAPTEPPTGTTPLPRTTTRPKPATGTTTSATPRPNPATGTTATTSTTAEPEPGTDTTATTPTAPPRSTPTAAELRATAARYVLARFRMPVAPRDVTLKRSRRKPRWAIASGVHGGNLWVVWLRDRAVALGTMDVKRFDPLSVPCDLRPAFSEPRC